MKRRLLNLLTLLSLVLCLGLGVAIARSYWVIDQWNRFRGTEVWTVELKQGHLFLVHARGDLDLGEYDAYRPRPAGRDLPPPWSLYESGSAEMPLIKGPQSGQATFRHRRLSLWWVAALVAVAPATSAARRVPWRRWFARRPPGLCRHCGYDLRATPDRCPECGSPASGVLGIK